MGCFSFPQEHKRKQNAPTSFSSLSVSRSVNNSRELNLESRIPYAGLQSRVRRCSTWNFRSKAAILNSASFLLAGNNPKALTGSLSLRASNGRPQVQERIAHSAPQIFVEHSGEYLGSYRFPLPLPPEKSSTMLSLVTPSHSSSHPQSIPASTLPSNNVGDTSKGGSSSSSSSSPSAQKLVVPLSVEPFAGEQIPLSPSSLMSNVCVKPLTRPSFPSVVEAFPLPLPPHSVGRRVLREYTYDELAGACQNFAPQFFIRDGGAGPVYHGIVKNEFTMDVAITCLTQCHTKSIRRWRAEVSSLAQLSHPHISQIIGFCLASVNVQDSERYLVYEHASNGCLQSLLYGRLDKAPLDWDSRLRIAIGAAQGLAYLHDRKPRRIVYKSFKPLNIQVGKDFNSKLSDYGFVRGIKELGDSLAHDVAMDDVYAAPETRHAGEISVKSNVWSFGMVVLELLTGRQNMDHMFPADERNLLQWARPYLLDARRLYFVMDPELKGRYSTATAKLFADIALQCLVDDPVARPNMQQVAIRLSSLVPPLITLNANSNSKSKNYGNAGNWKSKSYNLASILWSPARLPQVAHSKLKFGSFLSGEITKEASSSMAATVEHPQVRQQSFLSHCSFPSGEVLQKHMPSDSCSPSKAYSPPPLGRSLPSGYTSVTG